MIAAFSIKDSHLDVFIKIKKEQLSRSNSLCLHEFHILGLDKPVVI